VRAPALPAFVAAALVAAAGAAPGKQAALHLQLVAQGLASSVYVAAAPGEPSNLYVVEQPGRIRVLAGSVPQLSSFGQDGAGELYVVSQTGRVFKLTG
jgi:hypothetical protein